MRITLLCLLIIFGCNNNESDNIHSYRMPKPDITLNQTESSPTGNTELFSWNILDNWISANKTQFSQANYLIPSSRGSADISISYFAGNAGGVKANVNRWRKKLDLEELNKKQIELMGETFLSNIGEYKVYKIINTDNDEFGFLCSIIPAKNHTIFIKLKTYPETIDNLKKQFIEFCSSFDYNE